MDALRAEAQRLLDEGYNGALVANRLTRDHGLPAPQAARLVGELVGKPVASLHPAGVHHMVMGAAMFLAAVGFVWVSEAGGRYIVYWWGGMAWGLGQFLAGLKQFRRPLGYEPPAPSPDEQRPRATL